MEIKIDANALKISINDGTASIDIDDKDLPRIYGDILGYIYKEEIAESWERREEKYRKMLTGAGIDADTFLDRNMKDIAGEYLQNMIDLCDAEEVRNNTLESYIVCAVRKAERAKATEYADEEYTKALKEAAWQVTNGELKSVIKNDDEHRVDNCLSERFIKGTYNAYCEAYKKGIDISFSDYLTNCFAENIEDMYFVRDEDYEVCEAMAEYIKQHYPQMYERIDSEMTEDCWSLLERAGYKGTSIDVESFLKYKDYDVNIMLATPNERNLDMCAAAPFYRSEVLEDFALSKGDCDYSDNALTYLIHQQGHSAAEVCAERIAHRSDNKFIRSVSEEADNFSYLSSELAVCLSIKGSELPAFLDAVAHEQDYVIVGKGTTIGLFNEWDGYHNCLEICLEKPFVFPTDMIRNVQIEYAGNRVNSGYTVDTVGEVPRKLSFFGITKEAPVLYEEDMTQLVNNIKNELLNKKEKASKGEEHE